MRCILGVVSAVVVFLALVPRGWLQAGWSSGMITVKVHEWCFVCYVWFFSHRAVHFGGRFGCGCFLGLGAKGVAVSWVVFGNDYRKGA